MAKKLRILVLRGGPSTEHEISLKTGEMVFKNLDRNKYSPTMFVIEKKEPIAIEKILKKTKKFDFVFVAMHGAFGEDGRIQALLESIGAAYSGSGAASSAIAMDKGISNMIYAEHGLLVPEWMITNGISIKKTLMLSLPVVVKPVDGGSSVDVSIIKKRSEIKNVNVRGRIMVQEYIKGRELTCGIIEDVNGKTIALPPTEIIPNDTSFYDYRAKYAAGGSLHVTPPQLSGKQIKNLQRLAVSAHTVLGCSGMSRSDFILRGSKFYILETNTIPGMTPTSLLPQAAQAAGISFSKLLDLIIGAGLRRKRLGKRIIKV